MSTWFNEHMGNWNVSGLAQYPDLLAVAMTLVLTVVCAIGVKESTRLNNFLTIMNVTVILFVIIAGSFYTHTDNYHNFAPNGFSGIFTGAATAFFSYVGFDVIATSAEETVNPRKSIPIAIVCSLCLCMVCYVSVAAIITLMFDVTMPQCATAMLGAANSTCLTASQVNTFTNTPLAFAFQWNEATWAKYIISVGAICGLSTCLMTSIFPMPRIIYAISNDGLLPPWLGRVHRYFKTPVTATLLSGALAALLAMIFDLNALANMMSVGTLLSYTLVCASVLVLRYKNHDDKVRVGAAHEHTTISNQSSPLLAELKPDSLSEALFYAYMPDDSISMWKRRWTSFSASAAIVTVYLLGAIFTCTGLVVMQSDDVGSGGKGGLILLTVVGGILCVYGVVMLYILPRDIGTGSSFVAPFAPFLPLLAIFCNVYLLASLDPFTWIRFSVWCLFGTLIYVFYGFKHSKAPIEAPTPYNPVHLELPGDDNAPMNLLVNNNDS